MNSPDKWISDNIQQAKPFSFTPMQQMLINKLVKQAQQVASSGNEYKLALASAFDLLVSAEYYGVVEQNGWLTCTSPYHFALYPYTNICPQCINEGRFVYHRANKPKSGVIGAITSKLLAGFIHAILQYQYPNIQILRGKEPVDVIILDNTSTIPTVLFGEIKASPLMTFPLCVSPNIVQSNHTLSSVDVTQTPILIFLPDNQYLLGHLDDTEWAIRGILRLLDETDFFIQYYYHWQKAFKAYAVKDHTPIYWLTNGCGQPVPRPVDWIKRQDGGGYESISDSKTSVGMDRTDDIKKGIYQIFNLGISGKSSFNYAYKVGLISNIHAVRHYDDYLSQFVDVIWGHEQSDVLFNLFDGIIALTQIVARDEWVKNVFDF